MNSKKRANIKSKAQSIDSKVIIGAAQMHDNVFVTIDENFNNAEIVKVKVNRIDNKDKTEVRKVADQIARNLPDVEVVDIIGTTIILYKEHEKEEKRVDFD